VGKRALVLGAGGHAASSWEIGFVTGLADEGIDLRDADLLVGTSAGSRVAVQLASGLALEELVARQGDPVPANTPAPDWQRWWREVMQAKAAGGGPAAILRRIGKLALTVPHAEGHDRRWFVTSELPIDAWPKRELRFATVECETGERRVFDRTSGITLIDPVTASGALAGVWPPVAFEGRHYVDGGFYATENADLASDCARVLVLALRPGNPSLPVIPLDDAVRGLERAGVQVEVIRPDDATQAIFIAAGSNVLDPAVREPAVRSAREQGRRAIQRLAAFWSARAA
jgi:NTE family protein